ncbi:L,D-transpeptidase family protein [Thalassotalea aquiviva]|uniref:L,D-transpeptidase family protein n=1 Tax=Thalassotalea aquiviva TaxID=3242415 RepID=UPI00352AFD97
MASITESQYQTFITMAKREYLWLAKTHTSKDGNFLEHTLASLSLIELVEDLGWVALGELRQLAKQQPREFDRRMTTLMFSLFNLSNLNLHQNTSNANQRFFQPLKMNNYYPVSQENNMVDMVSFEQEFELAVKQKRLASLITRMLPPYDQVTRLRHAIKHYQGFLYHPWPKVELDFSPKLGQRHPKIKLIRELLQRHGDLPRHSFDQKQKHLSAYRQSILDTHLINGIKRFQSRHGLKINGHLDEETLIVLNTPVKKIVARLQKNLSRWFLLPKQLPDHYIFVNIPQFKLWVFEEGEERLEMKVIVGKQARPTPFMISKINSITLNPSWTPTRNIIQSDLWPEYLHNYISLHDRGFQLIANSPGSNIKVGLNKPNLPLLQLLKDYRLVQQPGQYNALGRYRFNLINNQSIFLHDTPVKSLFNKPYRALSHGCVRLEDADLLARYLLNKSRVQREQMHYIWQTGASQNINKNDKSKFETSALNSKQTQTLALNNSIPTFLAYYTVWVDEQGVLHQLPDVYGFDGLAQTSATESANTTLAFSQP